tara:strand:+ start:5430 stop:6698 length:1269 start_codon:yes stop_codon:yes gene_type:complete
MRLTDLRAMISNIVDYDPDTDAYRVEINRLINNAYMELFADKSWNFAQKEARITAHADVTSAVGVVTNGSKNVTTGSAFFLTWMAGQVIELPDGLEYEIASYISTTSVYLTTEYAGTTTNPASITVKQRYIDLPEDCVSVMQLGYRPLNSSTTPTQSAFVPVQRAEDEWYALPLDSTGTPTAWVPYDDFHVTSPVLAPASIASTAGGPPYWTAGTYEFVLTYKYAGRYSAPSPALSVSAPGGTILQATLSNNSTGLGSGYKLALWCRPSGYEGYRLIYDDIVETGGVYALQSPPTSAWVINSRRLYETDGHVQRVRLYPRQGTDTEVTLRYTFRPISLVEDNDTPQFPSSHHAYLGYVALHDICMKMDQTSYAKTYAMKAQAELEKMTQRFLGVESRRWVKQNMSAGRGFRDWWIGPATHTP